MIPAVPARGEHHEFRREGGGVIERADIDTEHVRLGHRLVVKRRAARSAEHLYLLFARVGYAHDFTGLARDGKRGAREHHDRGVPGAGIPLAIAALALETANWRGHDFVADF